MAANNSIKKPLTVVKINALKPDNSLSDIGENTGLNVACSKKGIKTFFYRYRSPIDNKVKRLLLGIYVPSISDENLSLPPGKLKLGLSSARQLLSQLKIDRKSGICPATRQREILKHQITTTHDMTMQELVELYLSQHIEDHYATNGKLIKGVRKVKGQKETRRTLEAVTLKSFGKLIAAEVTHVDIKKLITGIIANGTQVQAGRVLSELNLAFNYCIGRPIPGEDMSEYLPETHVNPCLQARLYFTNQKTRFTATPGKRYLTDAEIVKLLKWLPVSKFPPNVRHALMIVLLTGCRSGEAVAARKSEFNLDAGEWLHDTKMGFKQNTQLSRQAIDYIKPLMGNDTDYLLPSCRTNLPIQQKQLSQFSWMLRNKNIMLDIPPWTAHDLRRTCRTGLSKLGCPGEIAEAVLGHTKGGIEGVYNLYEYAPECKSWLQKWADHIDVLMGYHHE